MRPSSYATLRRRAEQRLSSIEHPTIASPFGTIEYAERGEGDPVLVLHGIFGGFDAAYLTVDPWIGDGFHVVAPSRFGCLGSSLPPNATVADQADAYAVLLDALGIRQAAVVGFSAGTVSAMQFGLRHPGRTTALVLMSGHYPQKHYKLRSSRCACCTPTRSSGCSGGSHPGCWGASAAPPMGSAPRPPSGGRWRGSWTACSRSGRVRGERSSTPWYQSPRSTPSRWNGSACPP
jgi:pimeloyl-ACP methyl ester carboxylesterase